MKKIYNNLNTIDIKVPFSYAGFLHEYLIIPELPTGMHWVNIDPLTDNFKFSILHKNGEGLSLDKLLDYFIDMYVGKPSTLDGMPIRNYWYQYIRKYGITQAGFREALSHSEFFVTTLATLCAVIHNLYEGLDLGMSVYQRNPRGGMNPGSIPPPDIAYGEPFNWGYEWEYGLVEITFKKPTPPVPINYIDFNNLHFTNKSETLFYKDEFGRNNVLTTIYPSQVLNDEYKVGDVLRFDVAMTLNGYFWLFKTTSTPSFMYYTWKRGSYGYSHTNFTIMLTKIATGWKIKTYNTSNVEIDLANEIMRLYLPTTKTVPPSEVVPSDTGGKGYARNVGNKWDGKLIPGSDPPEYKPYEPSDIPLRYRIWEYEEDEEDDE